MPKSTDGVSLDAPAATKVLMIVSLSNQKFAIALDEIRGVAPPTPPTRIPGTQKFISGLTYFRGGIEVLLDLGMVWNGTQSQFDERAMAILVEAEGMRSVLIVDQLLDLHDTSDTTMRLGDVGTSGRIGQTGVVDWRSEEIPLISIPKLLNSVSIPPTY